jgi:hypothetical protein
MKKISLFVLWLAPSVFAGDPVGFAFLRVPVGARPAAMGASFLAVSKDVHAIYYNPAGIADVPMRSGAFGYLNHVLDIQSFFGAYVHPHTHGSYGVAVNFTDYGDFTETDVTGAETGKTFGANNVAVYLTYSQLRAERWLFGVNLKLLRMELAQYSTDGVAADLGVIYHSAIMDNLTFAAGIFNLGKQRSPFIRTQEDLPLNFQLGISKRLAHLPLLYSLTVIRYEDKFTKKLRLFGRRMPLHQVRLGGEVALSKVLHARFGYDTVGRDQKVGTNADHLAGVSGGLGIKQGDYTLDVSLSSFGEVGSPYRVSFSIKF